ncbi:MAG TPA: UDP-2,3-diacylglucosamine diphosphatase [Firmicutes bacterium]|nr:UDP-2,3-diacylglucosamine diphosphatase [Bacillota bacterium]
MPGVVFISDLHLGDTRWTAERYELLDDFLDSFVAKYVSRLVIVGDLVEWIQWDVTAVARSFRQLQRIFTLAGSGVAVDYVIGNHDIDLCQIELTWPVRFVYPRLHLDIDGYSFHIEHGHFFDPTVNTWPEAAAFFTRWAGRALDKVGPGFEDVLGRFKERLLKGRKETTGQKGSGGKQQEMDAYKKGAMTACAHTHDFMVMGHTHTRTVQGLGVPGKVRDEAVYVNTGDWQVHSDFILVINGCVYGMSWPADRREAMAVMNAALHRPA